MKPAFYNRDKLMNASRREVARNTVSIFDRIQGLGKEAQVLALAAAFILMAQSAKVDTFDAFTAAKNLMADDLHSSGLAPQFAAMKYHLDTELLED